MLTDNDIYYFTGKHPSKKVIAIAFGIDGKVILDMPTYTDFYEMLISADEIISNNEDFSNISLIKDGTTIETLQTSSFLGSLIASNPDILVIFRPTNQEQFVKNQDVCSGWLYDENGKFRLPYDGWDTEMIDGLYNADREERYLDHYTGE